MPIFGAAEYLCYRVLRVLHQRKPYSTSRTKFHKLSSFADHYLSENFGQKSVLPRYWFMYGELLEEYSLNRDVFHAPDAMFWQGQQYLPAETFEISDFDISPELREDIDRSVDVITAQYWRANALSLRRAQYRDFAPNDFIKAYSELRDVLEFLDLGSQIRMEFYTKDMSNSDVVLEYLNEMLLNYPENDYNKMYDLYLIWDDTARMFLESESDFDKVEDLLNEFIRALSIVELRIHHSANIPEEKFEDWKQESTDKKEEFEKEIGSIREKALQGYEPTQILMDSLSESYSKAVINQLRE